MTLEINDLESRALDQEETREVAGGLSLAQVMQMAEMNTSVGQLGGNSVIGSASSTGVLNTTLNLGLVVNPQVAVSTPVQINLGTLTDPDTVTNSVL